MAEKDLDARDIERKVHDLAEAMNNVRSAQADRDDVVVDMKHAKISRLELLAKEVAPVFADIPEENEQFEFALTNGETPRLWIDMTSFVRMGADGREYEFVKDTRIGRKILGRSSNREQIGKTITDYVAERVLERERMIEGDWLSIQTLLASREAEEQSAVTKEAEIETTKQDKPEKASGGVFNWVISGLLIGLIVVFVAIMFDRFDPVLDWMRGFAG